MVGGNVTVGVVLHGSSTSESTGGGSNKQEFIATAGQTVFNVTAAPASLLSVFEQKALAIPTIEYSYNAGVLTFVNGVIVGTLITVIY